MRGVEFCSSDYFCELLHVYRLDVNDICDDRNTPGHNQTAIKTSFTLPRDSLKLWSLILRFQRLIRKSSAEMYVSWSELTEMECM